jgi:hypothetical protein
MAEGLARDGGSAQVLPIVEEEVHGKQGCSCSKLPDEEKGPASHGGRYRKEDAIGLDLVVFLLTCRNQSKNRFLTAVRNC